MSDNMIYQAKQFNLSGLRHLWEHAYLLDYKPAERPKYIEALFSNIDLNPVEGRLRKGTEDRSMLAQSSVAR
jgi:superoxide dismutase